jgi:photosystem II stability/assembly factor-like uncharacterized protein
MIRCFVITIIILGLVEAKSFAQTQWIQIYNPVLDTIMAIDFINPDSGYVMGFHSLYFSGDGGATWSAKTVPSTIGQHDIHFFSITEGLLISGRQLFQTTDGGNNWEEKSVPQLSANDVFQYFSFTYSNPEFGYIACEEITNAGFLLPYTSDKGETWQSHQILPHHVNQPFQLSFRTPTVGLGTFYFNETAPVSLYGTKDSGKYWVQKDSEGSGIIRPPGAGYSVTVAYLSNGEWISSFYNFVTNTTYFYKSSDDGANWNFMTTVDHEVYHISFRDSVGFASLDSKIIGTTDFGESWRLGLNPDVGYISHFSIPSKDVAYAVSYNAIIKTTRANKVETQNEHHELNTAPNPAQDHLTLTFEAAATEGSLEVFDALGRSITKELIPANTASYTLDIRGYAAGVYYVRMQNHTARFVKF